MDATDDPTHGNQQLTLFHGYFGQYQYFPLIISEPTTKHVLLAWLRPGTVHASLGAEDDLMRVVNVLRQHRPDIRIYECHGVGTNLRFVVTNLPGVVSPGDAEREYDHYVQRGESEQRMDELKNGLHMDRLSCHRFMANFFRLLLHTAAFNLLNAARDSADLPEVLCVGQPGTWRTMLVKVAAVIVQSTRRVVVKLADNRPWWSLYARVAQRSLSFSCGPCPPAQPAPPQWG